ncbi:MAG: hypothetical protein KatS3mg099_233 [Candidatus Parcubacteria bacterium]|nr:MAG: hypothetical protein KatS3mg099_233 [Candidatus Parcubacteria bacterium]
MLQGRPVVIATVLGVVVVLVALIVRFGVPSFSLPIASKSQTQAPASAETTNQQVNTSATSDRDQDGLLDWEELLWRTDADNPDTDGDGTPDGEEVASQRDPTKPGPDDVFEQEPLTVTFATSTTANDRPPTLTAEVAQRMLRRYFELKARGSDPRIVFRAQNEIWSLIPPDKENPFQDLPYWQEGDVQTRDNPTVAQIREYGNALARALMQPTPTSTPPQIFYRTARTQNYAHLKELAGHVAAIDAALSAMQPIVVPKPFVLHHLAIANLLVDQRAFLHSVLNMEEDPVTAAIAVRGYLENAPLLVRAFAFTADTLETFGAFYGPNEPGKFFSEARRAYAQIQQQDNQ